MRLLDSSIWIAFNRIGELQILLQVPELAAAPVVAEELRRGRDDLASSIRNLVRPEIRTESDDPAASTLVWILENQGISQADAAQIVYAQAHPQDAVLYMRDHPAEQVAARIGVGIRGHTDLVREMQDLGLIDTQRAHEILERLQAYFERRGRR